MARKNWCSWLLVFVLGLPVLGEASPFQQMFVFGDSLSDSGNAAALTGGLLPRHPPYDPLRFSNGPVAVEVLAAHLGIGLAPFVKGGNNYAIGGATSGTANIVGVQGFGMANEVLYFALRNPAFDPGKTLFVVSGGSNDFFINPAPAMVSTVANNIALDIAALITLGAHHILVPNLPDLGLTPFGLSFGELGAQYWTALSEAFNQQLELNLRQIENAVLVDLMRFDTFDFMRQMVVNPAAFGLGNVTEPCLINDQVCANPDSYLFWDGVHPTAYAHALVGARLAAAVPEPATVYLVLLGTWVLFRHSFRQPMRRVA